MKETVTILIKCGGSAAALTRTLESVFAQNTAFPYKVILYGGLSDAKVTEVLCHFRAMYPEQLNILSPADISLSDDPDVPDEILSGRYIAELSAGDVWLDPEKLQKQTAYLENHPNCSFCFSNSYDTDIDGRFLRARQPADKSRTFSARELMYAEKSFYAAASVLYRNDLYSVVYDPCAAGGGDFGDAPFKAYMACGAEVFGFSDFMVGSVIEGKE